MNFLVYSPLRAALHEPRLDTDLGQPLSQEGLPGKGGGGTRLEYCFYINVYKHLTAKGLPTAVIQPGLESNPGSCKEALIVNNVTYV